MDELIGLNIKDRYSRRSLAKGVDGIVIGLNPFSDHEIKIRYWSEEDECYIESFSFLAYFTTDERKQDEPNLADPMFWEPYIAQAMDLALTTRDEAWFLQLCEASEMIAEFVVDLD